MITLVWIGLALITGGAVGAAIGEYRGHAEGWRAAMRQPFEGFMPRIQEEWERAVHVARHTGISSGYLMPWVESVSYQSEDLLNKVRYNFNLGLDGYESEIPGKVTSLAEERRRRRTLN